MAEFVRRFQRSEPLTNLSAEGFGADYNDDETRLSLGCVPSVDQRLDASHPVRFARLAVALRVIKVETDAALQVRWFLSRELCAENIAVWHNELEKVLHHRARLGGIHLEQKVSIERDDTRSHLTAK